MAGHSGAAISFDFEFNFKFEFEFEVEFELRRLRVECFSLLLETIKKEKAEYLEVSV